MLLFICLRKVSYCVRVWATYIAVLINGILRSESRGRLNQCIYLVALLFHLVNGFLVNSYMYFIFVSGSASS